MKTILSTFCTLLIATFITAQTIELPETLISLNYKYLETQDSKNIPKHVKELESEVLKYNHKEQLSELYDDEYDTYSVSFYVPKGKIVAAYNKDGKIIRTIEKYNNVRLPLVVMQAVSKRFPNWGIVEDAYLIKYHCEEDSLKQEYKIKIQNEDETLTVKTNEEGIFI
jgi:uncharacterized membrane protein